MYNEELEMLIEAALADGVLTEKEKQVLFKKAQSMGVDLDEFEMVLDARLVKRQKEEKSEAAASAPKSTKFGDVRKCPVCGALVPALSAICPDCGFEFSGVEAISSAQQLADKLDAISGKSKDQKELWSKMASIVSTFPIPNAKGDLFEFAVSMKAKMFDKLGGETPEIKDAGAMLLTAYLSKYKESILKIKSMFPRDSMFSALLTSYQEDIRKAKRTIWWQRDHQLLWAVLAFIASGAFLALCTLFY